MRQYSAISRPVFGTLRKSIAGICAAAGLSAGTVAAQGIDLAPPADFTSGADALHPGQFFWTPSAAPTGEMVIYVDLSRQLAAVYRGGVRIGVTTISTGRQGYETPTGVFTILQKDSNHHSNKYENAPMPFQERLTWDGVALHAGGVPGYPESHGCVHLPYGFAKALFKETRMGTTVVMESDLTNPVTTSAPTSAQVAIASAPAPFADAPSVVQMDTSPERSIGFVANHRD